MADALPTYDAHALIPLAIILILGLKRDSYRSEGERSEWRYSDMLCVFLLASAITFLTVPSLSEQPPVVRHELLALVQAAALLSGVLFLGRRRALPLSTLGLRPRHFSYHLVWSLMIATAVGSLDGLLALWLVATSVPPCEWLTVPGGPLSGSTLADIYQLPAFPFVVAVVHYLDLMFLTPLLEEILFRAVPYAPLSRKVGYKAGAILSSVMWTSLHDWTIVRILLTFGLGLLYAYLFHRTRSLIPSLTLHTSTNAVASLGGLIQGLERSAAVVLPLVIVAMSAFLLCRAMVVRLRPDSAAEWLPLSG